MSPQRIQRKRTRGWRMPAGAIYVGRPSRWGNPFYAERQLLTGEIVTRQVAHRIAVSFYEAWITKTVDGRMIADKARRELRGHDLACWCRLDEPCHADVLLRIANE